MVAAEARSFWAGSRPLPSDRVHLRPKVGVGVHKEFIEDVTFVAAELFSGCRPPWGAPTIKKGSVCPARRGGNCGSMGDISGCRTSSIVQVVLFRGRHRGNQVEVDSSLDRSVSQWSHNARRSSKIRVLARSRPTHHLQEVGETRNTNMLEQPCEVQTVEEEAAWLENKSRT